VYLLEERLEGGEGDRLGLAVLVAAQGDQRLKDLLVAVGQQLPELACKRTESAVARTEKSRNKKHPQAC
jgi:hypothetical protein